MKLALDRGFYSSFRARSFHSCDLHNIKFSFDMIFMAAPRGEEGRQNPFALIQGAMACLSDHGGPGLGGPGPWPSS